MDLRKGDCLELMKTLPDKSVDLMICDLPYGGETNCKWDIGIDLEKFWKEFRRIRKSKRVACLHFCSAKFGYKLIQSWEKGFKMDMIWKKRNKTGGLQSRTRPLRNHELIYFFYDDCPKYNRDKYHKRIKNFASVKRGRAEKEKKTIYGIDKNIKVGNPIGTLGAGYEPVQPASVIEENTIMDCENFGTGEYYGYAKGEPAGAKFEPPLPVSMFESKKVFIGKRHHQTEKPQDILEFFLKYWSDEGDTILDPTMGSGSTGVACKKMKRNFIGFELDDKIYNTAKERIKNVKIE